MRTREETNPTGQGEIEVRYTRKDERIQGLSQGAMVCKLTWLNTSVTMRIKVRGQLWKKIRLTRGIEEQKKKEEEIIEIYKEELRVYKGLMKYTGRLEVINKKIKEYSEKGVAPRIEFTIDEPQYVGEDKVRVRLETEQEILRLVEGYEAEGGEERFEDYLVSMTQGLDIWIKKAGKAYGLYRGKGGWRKELKKGVKKGRLYTETKEGKTGIGIKDQLAARGVLGLRI